MDSLDATDRHEDAIDRLNQKLEKLRKELDQERMLHKHAVDRVREAEESNGDLQYKLVRALQQRDAARTQAERWQTNARKLDLTSGLVIRLASQALNKEGALDRLVESEKARDHYWDMLCEASDALGGPTPEKAPYIAQHIRNLLEEKAKMQEAIDRAVQATQTAIKEQSEEQYEEPSQVGASVADEFGLGLLIGILEPHASQE